MDETGVMVRKGIHLPTGSAILLNLLNSPTVRDPRQSKAAKFLISLLIPPDLIHPGPACCNPSVQHPPMFNMLMPPAKWMNHRGAWACNHFRKDRCINTPENPCLLVDNRLSVNRCVCAEKGIRF